MGIDKDALKRLASQFESGGGSPAMSGQNAITDTETKIGTDHERAGRQETPPPPVHIDLNVHTGDANSSGQSDRTSEIRDLQRQLEALREERTRAADDGPLIGLIAALTADISRRQEESDLAINQPKKRQTARRPVRRISSNRRVWPYFVAGTVILGCILYWDEITSKAEQWRGTEQTSDDLGQGGSGGDGAGDSGSAFPGSGNGSDSGPSRNDTDNSSSSRPPITAPPAPYEEPIITVPEYDPCMAYFANSDGEMAPGPDTTVPCRLPASLVYTPSGEIVEPNLRSGDVLNTNGTAYLLQEEGENTNFFIIDDDLPPVEWSIIPEETMSGIYTIKMRRLAVDGGYATDTTFGRDLNSVEITDKELFMFFTHNGIVPNYLETIYIKIVGSQGQCLRELALPSNGMSIGGGCPELDTAIGDEG